MSIGFSAWNQCVPMARGQGGFPRWLPAKVDFPKLARVDSKRNPPWPGLLFGKVLIMSQEFRQAPQGGFQVDSPVKKPRASEMPRSAPPYTDCAREEPWPGAFSLGPRYGTPVQVESFPIHRA
jgi:hypothetical protein